MYEQHLVQASSTLADLQTQLHRFPDTAVCQAVQVKVVAACSAETLLYQTEKGELSMTTLISSPTAPPTPPYIFLPLLRKVPASTVLLLALVLAEVWLSRY